MRHQSGRPKLRADTRLGGRAGRDEGRAPRRHALPVLRSLDLVMESWRLLEPGLAWASMARVPGSGALTASSSRVR